MDQDIVARVQRSWQLASDRQKPIAAAFYAHLFRLSPEARDMFSDNLALQHTKFKLVFQFMVTHLDGLNRLRPGLLDMGARHVAYGVAPEHYDVVAEALIHALQDELGTGFDADDATAWRICFDHVAKIMRDAGSAQMALAAEELAEPGGPASPVSR